MTVLSCTYQFHFQGDRQTVRAAINWCFDNCTGEWGMDRVFDPNPQVEQAWATMAVEFTDDRDAVLFKTFWNDR